MRVLSLPGLEVFLAVAEHGSLRRAAAALGLQPPAVTHRLQALEERIGVALFARTTRSVTLTDAGRTLLRRARPAMTELANAVDEARGVGGVRRGAIRVTLPVIAYEAALAARLPAFHADYPDIELDLSFDEGFVDIVREGFHAGVRMGDHVQQDMIAVRLTPPVRQVTFAAPTYLARHGRPREPRDLLHHNCIRYRYIGSRRIAAWEYRGPDGLVEVEVRGNLIVNSTAAAVRAVRDGLGLTWLFRPNIAEDLRAKRLVSVLDSHAVERPGFFLYYPRSNARLEVLRAFIEAVRMGRGT